MFNHFFQYWQSMSSKELRLCRFGDPDTYSPSEQEFDSFLDEIDDEDPGPMTLAEFLVDEQESEERISSRYTLQEAVEKLLKNREYNTKSAQKKKYYISRFIDIATADESDMPKEDIDAIKTEFQELVGSGETLFDGLEAFAKVARDAGYRIPRQSLAAVALQKKQEKIGFTPDMPPPPESEIVNEELSDIQKAIEHIEPNGTWELSGIPEEKNLGLRYYVKQTESATTIFRTDSSAKWAERFDADANKWVFAADYDPPHGKKLHAEHAFRMENNDMRKDQPRRVGLLKPENYGMSNKEKTRVAAHLQDTDERAKYMAVPQDGKWHSYGSLELPEGYRRDARLNEWQYRIFEGNNHLYARRIVRTNQRTWTRWGWQTKSIPSFQIMRLSFESSTWVNASQQETAAVLNKTVNLGPTPIRTMRW